MAPVRSGAAVTLPRPDFLVVVVVFFTPVAFFAGLIRLCSTLYPMAMPARSEITTPSASVASRKRGERSSSALFTMRFSLAMNDS